MSAEAATAMPERTRIQDLELFPLGLTEGREDHARELHAASIFFDGLSEVSAAGTGIEPKYFDEMRRGGITAANITVGGDQGLDDFESTMKNIAHFIETFERHADTMVLAREPADIIQAKHDGRTAFMFGFQDAAMLEGELAFLRIFHELGVRIIQPTFNSRNLLGDGCCEITDSGLSMFGRSVVDEMSRLGIILDLSHTGDATTMDGIEYSKGPVVISHAGPRSLCGVLRNKTDEQISVLARKGGVIGVCTFPIFLSPDQSTTGRPTLLTLLDQIDYTVNLAGVDHVGMSTDTNWKNVDAGRGSHSTGYWRRLRPDVYGHDKPVDVYPPLPLGISRYPEFLNITRGLISRGYSDDDIRKILGGNFMRVFEKVREGTNQNEEPD